MLHGVRIIDLTRLLPGGYATMLLARMGADVIKVEAPGHGDPIRGLPGGAAYFNALHRGKRSVAIRLKTEAGRRAFRKIVERADVLLEGFRPGVMERLGLGYDALRENNSRLVYCAITGYGSIGPYRDRAGHDLNYLARAGVLSPMPNAGHVPAVPTVQVADLAGGMQAVIVTLAALIERERTGQGSRLEIAMTDVARSWLTTQRAVFSVNQPGILLTGELPCYHVYAVRDGFLTVAALELPFWQAFCESIARPDLIPRHADPPATAEVAAVLRGRTRAEWMAHFGDRDVCVEPVLSLAEADPDPGAHTSMSPAPALGQHTQEVLAEAGLTSDDIRAVTGA
jgi:alpha-methylacyl-CoA racemase